MKRMHVHVAVDDLKRSIDFYSALFAAQPLVIKRIMPSGCSTIRA
jgi:predicted enzyme related to lactoylglutathione lyase